MVDDEDSKIQYHLPVLITTCYAGFFHDGLFNGNGILYDVDKSFYKGGFKNGIKHGYGLFIDSPVR